MKLSRRFLLRGAAAALPLPLLEVMLNAHGDALASGGPLPKRFGVFFWGNGTRPGDWTPGEAGEDWAPSANLQPLHDVGVVPDVTVVSGLAAAAPVSCHASGRAMMLSGSYDGETGEAPLGKSGATLPSCDQIAADHLGVDTTFPSVELAVSRAGIYGAEDTYSTAWTGATLLPAELSPTALFDRLFTGFEPDTTTLGTRLSIVDAVLADARRWRDRLGGPDRQRLEQHLDAVRDLEERIEAEPPECSLPESPDDPPEAGGEALRERTALFADVLAAALACDLTRVFTLRFTQSIGDTLFSEIGASEGAHTLSHSDAAMHSATVTYTIERFAELVKTFADTPDGAGRLLDQCALLATSDLGDGYLHGTADMPILVAGQAGGALRTGFHHRDSSGAIGPAVALTLLQAVGVPVASFGEGDGHVDVPLAAILA